MSGIGVGIILGPLNYNEQQPYCGQPLIRRAVHARRRGVRKPKLKQQDVAGSIAMDRQNLKLAELQLLFKVLSADSC